MVAINITLCLLIQTTSTTIILVMYYVYKMLLLCYYHTFNVILTFFDSNRIVTQYHLLCSRDSNTITQYQHFKKAYLRLLLSGLSVTSVAAGEIGRKIFSPSL